MSISVVIPCRNGAGVLERQLDALARQTTTEFEVVVADNGSDDGTAQMVAERAETAPYALRVVDASGRVGINHARNVGVRAARGARLLLCDADDEADAGWVEHMAAALATAHCVGGVVERVEDDTVVAVDAGVYEIYWPGMRWPIGASCGFRREVFDELGGFDESFRGGGDEAEFFFRAALRGWRTEAVPDARLRYRLRTDLRGLWRQHVGYGRGAVNLYVAFRDSGMPRAQPWRAPVAVARDVVRLGVGRSRARRLAVASLAQRYGRFAQSMRRHVIYL